MGSIGNSTTVVLGNYGSLAVRDTAQATTIPLHARTRGINANVRKGVLSEAQMTAASPLAYRRNSFAAAALVTPTAAVGFLAEGDVGGFNGDLGH
jgi:hypothetical protein